MVASFDVWLHRATTWVVARCCYCITLIMTNNNNNDNDKSSFVMVKSNPEDFARPQQSYFAECFANSLIYGTEDSICN